jgi:hypothetical protein
LISTTYSKDLSWNCLSDGAQKINEGLFCETQSEWQAHSQVAQDKAFSVAKNRLAGLVKDEGDKAFANDIAA